jgi:seryl-tRNA synthetase
MSLSLNYIRQNFEAFTSAMQSRGYKDVSPAFLLQLDDEKRSLILQMETLQNKKNMLAKQIGFAKANSENCKALMIQSNMVKDELAKVEFLASQKEVELNSISTRLPNILVSDVPIGKDENDNLELRKVGNIKNFNFTPKEHFEIGANLEAMDFETAANIAGSRFVFLYGKLAKLERALINFALKELGLQGYTEVSPPLLVNEKAYFGTGQLPKFEGDFFKTTDNRFLISTSEISLTNIVNDKIVPEHKLPLRYTAFTPCFRSEAGSSGKDTKGMIRLHQFYKVEMVSITTPEQSFEEHERMLGITESLLQKLELPYRVVNLCSGDIGATAAKTYDIEVFMPGQCRYREVASISNTLDYQARRMMARFKRAESKKNEYLHTLNGTAIACGRIICAIIENYQTQDGDFEMPKALEL